MNQNVIIPLESIQIATPCRADWAHMSGDDRARFCGSCEKNVYNLSAMTRDEAERLILEKEGHLCVRLHRRADGTVLTSDCHIGISQVKKSARWLQMGFAGVIAALLGIIGVRTADASKANGPTMGEVTTGAPMPMHTMGIVAPQNVMGKVAVPKLQPTPKATPTAHSTKKTHGNRASRTTGTPKSSLHRRHR